jgi:hypothetical protein
VVHTKEEVDKTMAIKIIDESNPNLCTMEAAVKAKATSVKLDGFTYLVIKSGESMYTSLSCRKGFPAFNIRSRTIRSIAKDTLVEVVSLEVKVSSGDPELETVDGPAPERAVIPDPVGPLLPGDISVSAFCEKHAFAGYLPFVQKLKESGCSTMQEAWKRVDHDTLLWLATLPYVLTHSEREKFITYCGPDEDLKKDFSRLNMRMASQYAINRITGQYTNITRKDVEYTQDVWLRVNTKPYFSRG